MEGRHDNMARCQLHHLQDALAEVGLNDLDALSLKILVQVALLGEHALALHHLLDTMRREDVEDDGIILVGILGPMDGDAVAHGVPLELFQIVGQMGNGVLLDLTGRLAQFLPLRQRQCHPVALLSHTEESIVVAFHHLRSLLISLSGL